MKNLYQAKLKKSAKDFHKNNRGERFTNGLIVRHLYDEVNTSKLSWWDDVGFIINDYLVQVSWVHPRLAFKDQVEVDAHKKIEHLDIGVDDFLSHCEPNYAKIGKSRKKIISHTLTGPLISSDWKQAYNRAYEETLAEANYKIRPSIKIEWTPHSRFVELCAPIEVKNEQELTMLANLVRALLKHETALELEFPRYAYTRDHWIEESVIRIEK
ncbi:hypothetical protein [Methylophilus sp. YYY-1]|uniref:hypothetical protein n=1 Tax=Methylophilus sp. YYY-1 TaxID=2682087 RepID=UPI0023B3381A|nr:hypothetical protein [Methylophilus sp. YYY-1]MDF0379018.1 hypothetical protein [Methylophilus sp. YYY-1]